jgi:uncharacterized protein YegP (UPF0339 family)
MPHRFKVTAAKGGQFQAKFVYNAETMVWSENYTSRDSARNCIASIKKNAPAAPVVNLAKGETGKGYRFEIAVAKNGETFVRFVAANGETMVRSETYKSIASTKNCIASIKKNGPAAEVVDEP